MSLTRPRAAARRLPLLAMLALGACGPRPVTSSAPGDAATGPTVGLAARAVSVAEFGTLRWLEGRWRGTQPDGRPFYESYRVADDSTITTYPDATSTTPSDSGAVALRGGVVATGSGGARWVVAELEPGRVHFAPDGSAQNHFTWVRRSPDAWTATLVWPATPERSAREVVYEMQRLRP